MTTRLPILSILLLCVGGCSTSNNLYTEKVDACLEQVENLSELGSDETCESIRNEWIRECKKDLNKEITALRVIVISIAFDFYSTQYVKAYLNFNKDQVMFSLLLRRIDCIRSEYIAVAEFWDKCQRIK